MIATKKFKVMFAVLITVLVIGLCSIFAIYYFNKNKTVANTNNNINQQQNNSNKIIQNSNNVINSTNTNAAVDNSNTAVATKNQDNDQEVKKLALNFAARFGTFSNQNDYQNLLAMSDYYTSNMSEWINNTAKKEQDNNEPYYSVKTQAVSTELVEISEQSAKVVVQTIRHETRGLPAVERQYNQKIEIQFSKENNTWKINSAYWQ